MTTAQEASLETTFQSIARIIARRYGVTVAIRGGKAYVDMERLEIVLPSMAHDSELQLEHLDGFLDHECAHVIHTNPQVFRRIQNSEKHQQVLHALWNGIEDVWIERAMGAAFFGCHQNLERLNVWLYATCEKRWLTMDPLQKLHYALERCYRGDHDKEKYADDPAIGAIMQQLQPEIDRGRLCWDSNEALAIAHAVLAKIEALAEESQGKGEADGAGTAVDCDAGCGGPPGAGADSQCGDGAEGESGTEEEPGDGDRDSETSADGGQADGGSSEAGPSEGEESEGKDAMASAGEGSEAQAELAQQQAQSFLEQEAAGFSQPLDAEGLVNEHLTRFHDWSQRTDPEQYHVFTEEHDYEITFNADHKDRIALTQTYNEVRQQVQSYVGNLASVLELTLAAEAEDRWVGGARRGKKFDNRRLAHWAEGSDDDRIFRYMEQGVRHDTAVTLLWDCSGSMGNSQRERTKAALARIAAVAFHEALRRCPYVVHEVLGFHSGGGYSERIREMVDEASGRGEDLSRYSRLDELDARMVFVPFGENRGWPIAAITGSAANRDGECVLWAARRLAQRPERRKILIVGSDGHPQGARYHRTECNYLHQVVRRVMAAGVELHGLGIMDESVKKYYPSCQVVHEAQQLPRAVLTLLTSSLPAHRGRNEGVADLRAR